MVCDLAFVKHLKIMIHQASNLIVDRLNIKKNSRVSCIIFIKIGQIEQKNY